MEGLAETIYKAVELGQDKPRPHLGASMLGHHCERWVWLSFRLAVIEKFSGRILLLFGRGHSEEPRAIELLKKAGISVDGRQTGVDFGCHVSGSADGVIESLGAVLEIKTHSDKSFKELVKVGVKKAKPMHWVQMCVYGYGLKLKNALYYAVNKNTDEIHTEPLELDFELAAKYIKRGQTLAVEERIPPPISNNPSWYLCKCCAGYDFCHGSKTTKEINCRTCAHSTPKQNGTWRCERHDSDNVLFEHQLAGCDSHTLHPDLVPWELKGWHGDWSVVYEINGRDVVNGCDGVESVRLITC